MAIRLPAGLLRTCIRIAVKPFLGPPFPVWFQRAWLWITSMGNVPSRAASMAPLDIEGMSSLRAWPKGRKPDRAILYLHGGAYCVGSWKTHRGPITHLAVACGAQVYAPNYRLAPEHPHPAALDDALKAYRWLLGQGGPAGSHRLGGGLRRRRSSARNRHRDPRLRASGAGVDRAPFTLGRPAGRLALDARERGDRSHVETELVLGLCVELPRYASGRRPGLLATARKAHRLAPHSDSGRERRNSRR